MDFLSVVQAARRHWKVVLVLAIGTALAAGFIGASVPVSYEAKGAVLLEAPVVKQVDAEGRPVAQNRFLNGGGTLNVVGDVIARVVNDDSIKDELEADGAGAYEVTNQAVGAPLLTIVATSSSGDQAVRTVQAVSQAISDQLVVQQYSSGVDEDATISARELIAPQDPDQLYGGRTRAVAVVVLLGLAASLSVAVLLDVAARRHEISSHDVGGAELVAQVGNGSGRRFGSEAYTPIARAGARVHRPPKEH